MIILQFGEPSINCDESVFRALRVLPGLNMVSEIHRPVLQAVYLLNPVNEAEATYDYELIMTRFLLSTILFWSDS